MQLVRAKVVEDIGELLIFVDKVGGGDQTADIRLAVDRLLEVIAGVQDTDDVVDVVFIDGNARVALADDQVVDILHAVVDVDNGHIDAGGQYLLRGLFVEFQRRLHEFGFLLFEDTFLLDALDDVFELVLGDRGGALLDVSDLHDKALDADEEIDKGSEDVGHHLQEKARIQHDAVALFLADTFRYHLAEGQHEKRRAARRDRRAVVFKQVQAQNGRQGRAAEVDDVVADQNGGQGFVEVVADP